MFQHPEQTEGKTSRATPSAIKLVGLNCKHTVEFTRNLNGRNSYANKRLEQSLHGWHDTANVMFPHLIDICKHNINFHKIFSLYASKSLSNNYEKEGMMLRPVVGACRIMLIMRWILARKKPFLYINHNVYCTIDHIHILGAYGNICLIFLKAILPVIYFCHQFVALGAVHSKDCPINKMPSMTWLTPTPAARQLKKYNEQWLSLLF